LADNQIHKPSDILTNSASDVMNRVRMRLLHGAGYNTDRLKTRPLIAIANSHTELTTGHSHLALLARRVRDGIIAAGGEAAEFNVPTPSSRSTSRAKGCTSTWTTPRSPSAARSGHRW
jgi:dihydroxyacid dehydratase/phosphogluconate dehydratase